MNLDVLKIETIVKTVANSGVHEVTVSDGVTTLTITNAKQANHTTTTNDTPTPSNAPNTIVSHAVGKFVASIDGKSALQVGDGINVGDVVASTQALGILTPIISDKAGVIATILVSDGDNVEYGQAVMELA